MIYKGPSIYKFGGGGGGGYNDGGQLVDGDFIKLENNTVYSFSNDTRDPINFYMDLQDGEIANSIVELYTEVNTTVNVYYKKNGLFYLFGLIGSNSGTAQNSYTVSIQGNSYTVSLQSVTPDISAAEIDGAIYPVKKIGSLYWTTENIHSEKFSPLKHSPTNYYYWSFGSIDGWRLPTEAELVSMFNLYTVAELKSTSGWNEFGGGNGNNNSGMNFKPLTNWNPYSTPPGPHQPFGSWATCMCYNNGSYNYAKIQSNYTIAGNDAVNVRLVHAV